MDHPAWLACTGGGLLLDQGCRIISVFLDIAIDNESAVNRPIAVHPYYILSKASRC